MALAGDLGVEIELSEVITEPADLRADRILYSESQGRVLVSVSPVKEEAFLDLFEGLPCRLVGRIREDAFLRVRGRNGDPYLEEGLPELREAYKRTLWW
jgi:phosphoribosylformylglycinamidine (FGAM) synthase-like enzyme